MAELTPMMRQYLEIKERHPDCILFFRLGDFYEMFADDAKLASHELDLTLTTRDRGKEKSEQVPMCGVPYHSAESYIARLVARGYKVAICEQMEDPALAKGLVKRDITRIVTPGTVIESSMLDESRNNYFACVFGEDGRYGLSFCDISTGAFYATQAEGAEAMERVISELGRFAPAEVLRGGDAAKSEELTRTLQERLSCCADLGADELFDPQETAQLVEKQFGKPLDELGLTERPEVWRSAGALLRTLCELQKTGLSHVRELEFYVSGRFMELDLSARRNLELTETMRTGEKKGTLLVPAGYVDESGFRLGVWISNLRAARKARPESFQVTPEHIAMLDAIGMQWDAREAKWDGAFRRAEEYRAAHGDLLVPVNYKTGDGFCLGDWIRRMRESYAAADDRLTAAHIQKLEALGMVWTMPQES